MKLKKGIGPRKTDPLTGNTPWKEGVRNMYSTSAVDLSKVGFPGFFYDPESHALLRKLRNKLDPQLPSSSGNTLYFRLKNLIGISWTLTDATLAQLASGKTLPEIMPTIPVISDASTAIQIPGRAKGWMITQDGSVFHAGTPKPVYAYTGKSADTKYGTGHRVGTVCVPYPSAYGRTSWTKPRNIDLVYETFGTIAGVIGKFEDDVPDEIASRLTAVKKVKRESDIPF